MAKSLEEIEAEFRQQFRLEPDEPEETEEAEAAKDTEVAEVAEEPAAPAELPVPAADSETGNGAEQAPDLTEKKSTMRATIISDFIFYFALISMILCAVIFSQGGLKNGKLGGYHFYEVLTTSMESVYPKGCMVVVKQTDPSDLNVGDDITFYKDPTTTVTHRIIEIVEGYENTGKRGFVTKGVDNAAADTDVVMADNVVGKVVKGIPYLGAMMTWLSGNLIVLLFLFISLIALSFFIKYFWRESKQAKRERQKDSVREMISEWKEKRNQQKE